MITASIIEHVYTFKNTVSQNIKQEEFIKALFDLFFWYGEEIFKRIHSEKSYPWQDWFDFCEKMPPSQETASFRDLFEESYLK